MPHLAAWHRHLPCTGRGCPPGSLTAPDVRSYRTVSPLPEDSTEISAEAGLTPTRRPRVWRFFSVARSISRFAGFRELPGALLCGARTFLTRLGTKLRRARPPGPPQGYDTRNHISLTANSACQLPQYAYHVGQLAFIAKHLKSADWQSLSIPRGKSADSVP